ncbi:Levodione reductase [Fulvia fulva]|nr:Levodione reductase [Fulvia fulva]WPV15613.1 Levodione reductase [Fulvia fulva]WPV30260.1 Levodione reductase [Fulvia fulva]
MTANFPIYPDLKGKVALITGIGQVGRRDSDTWGNGAATARVLSHNGVKIVGCDINLDAANYTKKRLLQDNPEASIDVFSADMTSVQDIEASVKVAEEKYGRIDILYNNVGITAPGDPGNLSEEAWQKMLDLNLNSVFRCCRLVIPIMERQGSGAIVNNASITAMRYIGKPQIGYATAKAAVIQYKKASGCMYGAKGIRFNCVVPGLMYTPLVVNLAESDKPEDQEVARKIMQHNVPLGRMGDGVDVANAVAFLASDVAKYVTSHALVVDGGITESTGTGGL